MGTVIEINIFVMLLLTMISILLFSRQQRRTQAMVAIISAQLEEALTMLQLTQKHRALGAQRDQMSVAQREQMARQIERNWPAWLRQFPESQRIDVEWAQMRLCTDDFAAHCRAIDHLLVVISRLERRMPPASIVASIADCCRAIEDLGRLRGLSMRAANYSHCAIELEVPLRYLCLRLSHVDNRNAAMHAALREIGEQLLDAPRVSIKPARCFELLTPIIDAAIDDVRRSITQPMHVESRERAAIVAVLKTPDRPSLREFTAVSG